MQISLNHWMTFSTFAEQRFFVYPTPKTYKGVIINANMVAHAPDGMAAFLLERTQTANFIIDPLTHAFQHDIKYIISEREENNQKQVKSSISKLAGEYGEFFSEIVGSKPVTPDDFDDRNKVKDMVTQCIDFQRKKLQTSKSVNAVSKYLSDNETNLNPYALVAPYFYLTEINYKDWLPIMKICWDESSNIQETQEKLFVAIVISKEILGNEKIIKNISSKFPKTDGFLVWVDQFDEQLASMYELKNFITLCQELKRNSNEVINLHGGYFSILLTGKLGESVLSGVAHGPEFGEHRSVIPVGGGIPVARYYTPKLFSRIRYRDAFNIFSKLGWLKNSSSFYDNVCSCEICKGVISHDIEKFTDFGTATSKQIKRRGKVVSIEYPTKETKEICLKHYLNVKEQEYGKAIKIEKKDLLSELEDNRKIFEKVVGLDFVSYLEKWHKVFSSNS